MFLDSWYNESMLVFPKLLKYFIATICLLLVFIFGANVFAQSDSNSTAVLNHKAVLEAELAQLEKEIDAQKVILGEKQRERVSFERDVDILTTEISKAKLSIKARNLAIEKLNGDIDTKGETISDLGEKIEREKKALAELLRETNKFDAFTLTEIVLSGDNLSDFFNDIDAFQSIKIALHDSLASVSMSKKLTEIEKNALEDKKNEEVDLRVIQELEKKRIEEKENEKKKLLNETKGVEATYAEVLKAKEKTAAQIRAELFNLRGSAAIPFDKAYQYATHVSEKTGVRAALILGIIAEESNLGENVGTGNWREDMKDPRDTVPFLEITKRLGLDPDSMPVSKKPWYGWGGAMGPAQFIPSTWVLYEERIGKATGHNPPNPWDPQDAFMASGILLMDNGADGGTFESERLAALRYFAGWTNAKKPAYAFYGDDVMALAAKYQNLIDILDAS